MCNSFTQTQSTQGRTMKKLLVISAITATALFASPVADVATKAVDAAADAAKTAVVEKATEAVAPDANKTEEKATEEKPAEEKK